MLQTASPTRSSRPRLTGMARRGTPRQESERSARQPRKIQSDTIHLVGTIGNQLLWPYATGTGVAGLRIYFEPNARLSAPTWPGGAIKWESAGYAKNNVIIDGGTNGVIECTANGTLLANHVNSCGISFISASHLTIKNLTISNIYIRVNDASNDQVDGGSAIYGSTGDGPYTDFTVQDCVIHDANIGINAPYTNGSARYSFLRNQISNINWGIGSGSASTNATMDNWLADGNNIHDFANWDAPSGYEAFHHNGIFLWGSNGTNAFRSWTISNNTFGPNFGTRATGGVYLSSYGMTGAGLIAKNVFIGSTSNGLLTVGTGTGSVVRVYNNTFVCNSTANTCINIGGSSASAMSVDVKNNISFGGAFINGNMVGSVTLTSNYNLAFGFSSGYPGVISWSTTTNGNAVSWANWQSTFGQDTNSVYNKNPLLDGNCKLQAGSPAIGAGTSLLSSYTSRSDLDLGAYAYSSVSALAAPSNAIVIATQ